MQIDQRVLSVIERLDSAEHEAYLVGGCIRDRLIGKEPKDWDIATSALPEDVLTLFADMHVIETGLKHGTVTVVSDALPVEVTTFRTDGVYEDNRRPASVTFVKNIEEDLSRRDFTMNAIAYHPVKGLVDPFDGVLDLNKGLLRSVGNPDDRFTEDGLRILRALRFASVLSLEIDSQLSVSIHRNMELLRNISAERIAAEFTKLLCGDGVEKVLTFYSDIIAVFIPEVSDMVGFDQKNQYHSFDAWTHTVISVASAPKDPLIRLTMFFHDFGKPACFSQDENGNGHFYGHEDKSAEIAKERLQELKCSNEIIGTVCELVRWHDVRLNEKNLIKWLGKLGENRMRQLFEVKAADAKAHSPEGSEEKLSNLRECEQQLDEILAEGKCFSLKDLAVDGDDLLALGIPAGPGVGKVLSSLLEAVMNEQLPNEKQALLHAAQQTL